MTVNDNPFSPLLFVACYCRTKLNGFAKAIDHDPYFSAAYFQSGVANIMLGNFGLAVKCFDLAYKVTSEC
jgi:hypothetical protein